MLRLAEGIWARGHAVEVVVGRRHGELADCVPAEISVFDVGEKSGHKKNLRSIRACLLRAGLRSWPFVFNRKLRKLTPLGKLGRLPDFAAYLSSKRPDAVLAAEPQFNLIATLARRITGVDSRVVISERVHPGSHAAHCGPWAHADLRDLLRRGYLDADGIVAVSNGVADDLSTFAGIPRDRVSTVYNPVVGPDLLALAEEPLDHLWFAPEAPPVILAAGRIAPQKDYLTLIRAFFRVSRERRVRLVILGAEGDGCADYMREVRGLVAELGLADDVLFPGYVANPFAYMSRAAVFVLSSVFEGLPGVLIQALACGCPVLSTDCPSGPTEILEEGRYGPLVPMGDERAMAEAIDKTLDRPLPKHVLRARGAMFSVDKAVDGYLELLLGPNAVAGADHDGLATMAGSS